MNSSLISYTRYSPNYTFKRTHIIDTITIHTMAGNLSVEKCGALFADVKRKASSNYGIDSSGKIALYVDEQNRSWCTSSPSNDHRAITIEVASIDGDKEPYRCSEAAYNSLIALCVDICKRNGIDELLWRADKDLIGQVDKQNMTVHRWFDNRACPGEYLYSNMGRIAADVNEKLKGVIKLFKEELIDSLTPDEALEIYKKAVSKFRDNDAKSYSLEARDWAIKTGLIEGDDNSYSWEAPLTREQFVTVLKRYDDLRSEVKNAE